MDNKKKVVLSILVIAAIGTATYFLWKKISSTEATKIAAAQDQLNKLKGQTTIV